MDADHFNTGRAQVKYRAFWPRPRDNELSVMRIEELEDEQVWALGDNVAAAGRTILARADCLASGVRSVRADHKGLDVVPDEPPVRHALIVGWPNADREERKSLAQQLAALATLVVR